MKIWIVFLLLSSCSTVKSPWSNAKKPIEGKPEPIGYYSAGCLAGGKSLNYHSENYIVMRPSRQRYYGHPNLLNFIEKLGNSIREKQNKVLLIGDLSQPMGGPMIYAHASHQVGLDVDIWFRMIDKGQNLSYADLEQWSADSYVKDDKLTSNWHEGIEKMIQYSAMSDEVQRVLVNPTVKKYFCAKHAGKNWMTKVRAWYGHDDHAHVRLYCPKGALDCRPQSDPPEGDGCDKNLEWWFSEEAKLETKNHRKSPKGPVLPKRCLELL